MKRRFAKAALAALAVAVPLTAANSAAIEGQWKNKKGSVVVRVHPCGNAYCGTVVNASAKAKAGARKGGTPNLVGTRILSGLRPAGDNIFKGQAFEPKRNIRAPATLRLIGPDTIEVKGCAIAGLLLCKEQHWTRVS